VQAPQPSKQEVQALSPEKARKFQEAFRGDRLDTLYLLAINAGLREGELLGLRWRDIDLKGEALSVRQQLTRTREGLSFTKPKRDKTLRVKLTGPAVSVLKRHKASPIQGASEEG
jgi:integrase